MHRIRIGARLVAAITVSGILASEARCAYPPNASLEEVQACIAKASKEHPRLLATRSDLDALRKSLDTDPLRKAGAHAVVRQAELMRDASPVVRKLEGRRLLGVSRTCVKRVLTLAMAYHLTGDRKHVDRCKQEMLAAARFSDWNPSHFLDVAEMTFALAIGYDWLYDQFDDDTRAEIRTAIVRKGVALPWETRHNGWVKARNNWGQVCHGGLTAGALAVLEYEPELAAKTVHNALQNVTRSMAAFAPEGGYPEGPGYWAYGTSYNVLLIAVLESALGTDFGLSAAPGFDKTGQFLALATGPSGLTFNYADGGADRGPEPALWWFASRYDRPDWLLGERELLQGTLGKLNRDSAAASGGRLLPLALLWMHPTPEQPDIHMPLDWSSGGEVPVTIHRSSWTDPRATFVGVKAGSPSAPHGQMDVGSFVLDCDTVRWAVDLGAEGYHGIESRGMNLWSSSQGSDRWKIFRQSNEGHNTLVIDGELQRASGHGKIVDFASGGTMPHTVVDLSEVYKGQAETVVRGVALLASREVLIRDELKGLKPGSRVRWGMITPGEPRESDGATIELRQRDASLTLHILSPQATAWQTIDTAKPRNAWDSPNQGTRMIAFEAVAPPSGKLTLAVLATPGSCGESLQPRLKFLPLERWRHD